MHCIAYGVIFCMVSGVILCIVCGVILYMLFGVTLCIAYGVILCMVCGVIHCILCMVCVVIHCIAWCDILYVKWCDTLNGMWCDTVWYLVFIRYWQLGDQGTWNPDPTRSGRSQGHRPQSVHDPWRWGSNNSFMYFIILRFLQCQKAKSCVPPYQPISVKAKSS